MEFKNKENIKKELDLSIANREKDKEYINRLKRTKDKVKYLRIIKRYTQIEAAEIIGITTRQIQRIEKEIKKPISKNVV
jgi:DNA-binding XRE family transcriptional regulator